MPTAEVTGLNPLGFWLSVGDREYRISFQDFPFFRTMTLADLLAVRFSPPGHLRWESSDIDLELDSLEHPELFPLVFT
jgi:hypothetical protein